MAVNGLCVLEESLSNDIHFALLGGKEVRYVLVRGLLAVEEGLEICISGRRAEPAVVPAQSLAGVGQLIWEWFSPRTRRVWDAG